MGAAAAVAVANMEDLRFEPSAKNSSGYMGVFRCCSSEARLHRPYQARRGSTRLGEYTTAEEAALMYARHMAQQRAATAAEDLRLQAQRIFCQGIRPPASAPALALPHRAPVARIHAPRVACADE